MLLTRDLEMKVRRHTIRGELEVRKGGGFLGLVGMGFALCATTFLIAFGVGGGFATMGFMGSVFLSTVLGILSLGSLGLATFRERIRFDANRGCITQTQHVFFFTYERRQWSIRDFAAVTLYWDLNHSSTDTIDGTRHHPGGPTTWRQAIRLLPAIGGAGPAEPLELGRSGKETCDIAQEIAEFCNLPLHQTRKPKDR